MKFILGKKVGMTQIWREEEMVPVTKIQAGPCFVTQVKTENKDGYNAIQVGFGEKKEKNIRKPQKGHLKSFSSKPRYIREFRVSAEETERVQAGDRIDAGIFEAGERVDIAGTSKGRGFQGVVKRYGFAGASKTHGTKDQERMPGSAGAMGAGRIFPGKKMPGRMGGEQVTTKNLEIVDIDTEAGTILIKGGISGPSKGLVSVSTKGELQVISQEDTSASESEQQEGTEESAAQEEQPQQEQGEQESGEQQEEASQASETEEQEDNSQSQQEEEKK